MKKAGVLIVALCMLCCGAFAGCKGPSDKVKVECPDGKAELCDSGIVQYLDAGEGADVSLYSAYGETVAARIEILWGSNVKGLLGYTLQYGTKKDMSDAVTVELPADREWYDLYNLYKGTKYYVRVWAHNGKKKYYAQSSFTTTDRGPRVMHVDGIYNVRDLGGYATASGKTVKQGLVYRGTALNDEEFGIRLTRDGKAFLHEQMGIRSEISLLGGNDGVSAVHSSVPMYSFHVSGYGDAFRPQGDAHDYTGEYAEVFKRLAKPETYPTYIHCQGGADRTGTVCFLLNALLGVGLHDLTVDWEFTSFAMPGTIDTRSSLYGFYAPYFAQILDGLGAYEGDTLMQQTENYLLDIGVTAEEIASIRSILLK